MCQVWLKLALWFWENFFLKFRLCFLFCFLLFRYYLPLKRMWPFTPMMLSAKFGWNWPSGSWEGNENMKSLRQQWQQQQIQQRRWTTDKFRWEKLTYAFSLGEHWVYENKSKAYRYFLFEYVWNWITNNVIMCLYH